MILPWFVFVVVVVVGDKGDVELIVSFSDSGSGDKFKDELLELLYNDEVELTLFDGDDVLFMNEENTLCGSSDVSNIYTGELVIGSWIPVL